MPGLRLSLLAVTAASALAAVASVISSAGAGTSASVVELWSGTVQVRTDFPEQTQSFGPGYSFTYSRTDSATYTLTGTEARPGVYAATMRGQGTGRAVNVFSPPNASCVAAVDPAWGWSYSGPSTVDIGYGNGQFSIRPRGAPGMVQNTYLNPECAGGSNEPFAMIVPPNIEQANPIATQQAPSTASTLTGQQTFRWLRNDTDTIAGTMTVTWSLRRGGAAVPPTGIRSGTVLVNGKPYRSGRPIPYGSTVDVTAGRLALTTEVGALTVYGGGVSALFKLLRASERGKPLVELRLVKGDFAVCKRTRALAGTSKPGATVRRLWAKGKGSFRTRGRYSASTVRGTFWLTADRCDGTLTSVKQGTLEVFDFPKRQRLLVRAGKSYVAAPKR